MRYDVFISYSRKDITKDLVTELKNVIKKEYFVFPAEGLNCFFDTDVIKGMEDWIQNCCRGAHAVSVMFPISL